MINQQQNVPNVYVRIWVVLITCLFKCCANCILTLIRMYIFYTCDIVNLMYIYIL